MKEKYDPAADVVSAITTTIRMASPRDSFRGRKDRDRIARLAIAGIKSMMNDKRMKK